MYCSGESLFEVGDNLIRLEVWCYFVQFLYNHLDEQACMRRNLVLFLVYSYIHAQQWTDICNTRCSILSRFSHFHVSHFPPRNMVPHFHVSHFQHPLDYINYSGAVNDGTNWASYTQQKIIFTKLMFKLLWLSAHKLQNLICISALRCPRSGPFILTRSSAIAEAPRDASCQLKFVHCHETVQKLLVRQVLNKSKSWS